MQGALIKDINLGGIADSDYQGGAGSVASIVGLNIHDIPGLVKVNQKLTKNSGVTVTEQVKVQVASSDGNSYHFSSSSGKIWQRTSAGVWALIYTTVPTSGTAGCLGASEYNGYIYWATQNYLHRIPVTGTTDASAWTANAVPNWKELHIDQEVPLRSTGVLSLDGVDDYVAIGSNTMAIGNDFAFSCWFYVEKDSDSTNRYCIWGAADTAGNPQIELGGTNVAGNHNRVCVYNNATIIAETSSDAFESGKWNHLVYTRSGTGTDSKIFINGVDKILLTNDTTDFANAASVKHIGTRTTTAGFFPGKITEVLWFDNNLVQADVDDIYVRGQYASTNLIARYYLNRDVNDSDGTAHGTLTNGAEFILEPNTGFEEDLPSVNIPPVFRYIMTTAVSESDIHKQVFIPSESVVSRASIYLSQVGTGTVTVKVHNSADSEVGTATVANGSLVEGWNEFNFTDFNVTPGNTYHIHVYSSVADSYLRTVNQDVLDTWVKIFNEGDTTYHPMKVQNLVLYIGDRNFVHQVDVDSTTKEHIFNRKALDLPSEYTITCLGRSRTDLVIGTIIASTINECQVFIWNTWGETYHLSDPVLENGINAMIEADDYLLVNAGKSGNLYVWTGDRLKLYKSVPGTYDNSNQAFVYPNAVTNFKGLPLFGLSSDTGDPTELGVYSFGSKKAGYPTVLNLEYPVSPRQSSAFVLDAIEIGSMLVSGDDLFVAWKRYETITVTIAAPAVVTYTAHNFSDGDPIVFSTTGALPTGITAGTVYYVRSTAANTLNLYDTSAHAISGGATGRVDTSGSQSGVHTGTYYGVDKIDYTAKLEEGYFETRVIDRGQSILDVFRRFNVHYKLLPASTSIEIKYKLNHATSWTAMTVVDDTDRNMVFTEDALSAIDIQLRIEFNTSSNNSPEVRSLLVSFE